VGFRVVLLTASGFVTLAKNRPVNIWIQKHQLLRKVIHDTHSQVNIQTVSRKETPHQTYKGHSYLFKFMMYDHQYVLKSHTGYQKIAL